MQVSITGDINRTLQSKTFVPSSTIAVDIPRDSVFKHLQVRISGGIQTDYGSGTPVSENRSPMANLINYMNVVSNGSFTIKNVMPWMLAIQSLIATAQFPVRRGSAGAAAVTDVTADGKFPYGTDDQYSSIVQSCLISFENVLAGDGRMETLFDTRGLASAELNFQTGAYAALLGFGNTAPVIFANSTLQIQTTTIESQNIPNSIFFSAWKQTTKQKSFTAQTNDELVDINRGNFLQGILLEAHDGASGSATTATGKVLSNILLTSLKLIVNGSLYIKNDSFNNIQDSNRNRYGLNAAFSGNVSLFDGMAYMDLLTPARGEKFGALNTAQDLRAPNVDACQLSMSTSSSATYTSTAYVNIMTNEIVPPSAY